MDKFILFYLFQLYGIQIKGSKKRKKAHSAVLMIVYCKNKFCHEKKCFTQNWIYILQHTKKENYFTKFLYVTSWIKKCNLIII